MEITVFLTEDFFGGVDPKWNDATASFAAYINEVEQALSEEYPEADITVRSTAGTDVVSVSSTSSWDEDTALREDVHAIIDRVWQRGSFWVSPVNTP